MKRNCFKLVTPRSYIKGLKEYNSITIITSVTRNCVLKCKYCYARDPKNPSANRIMERDVLEKLIHDAFDVRHKSINFEWTGGEALLAGKNFFENVLSLQKKHAKNGKKYSNCIQTSGAYFDKDLYDFLIRKKIRLSLTIDGPRDLHDFHRPIGNGKGSFDTVLKSYKYILKKQGHCGVLCTATKHSLSRVQDIINFYRGMGIKEWYTNPYIFDPQKPIRNSSIALTGQEVGQYFIDQYDYLIKLNDPDVKPDYFMSNLNMLCGLKSRGKCSQGGRCLTNLIDIDNCGNVTLCARFLGSERFRFGNIMVKPLKDIISFSNPIVKNVIKKRVAAINKCIRSKCIYMPMCNSGCPYDSYVGSGFKELSGKDYLCEGKLKYFGHLDSKLKQYGLSTITDYFSNQKGGKYGTESVRKKCGGGTRGVRSWHAKRCGTGRGATGHCSPSC